MVRPATGAGPPARTPELVNAIRSAASGRARADQAFELGIDLLLGGLARFGTNAVTA